MRTNFSSQVNWYPVFWGIAIQYIFALILLRTTWGYNAIEWMGDRVTEFIMNAQAGADFVFGGLPQQKIFAFYVSIKSVINNLTLKAPTTTAADDKF